MKLRNQSLTQPQISKHEVVHESEKTRHDVYVHPWYDHIKYKMADDCPEDMKKPVYNLLLKKPNPPTKEAVEKAEFVDKTYKWTPNTR